MAVDMFLKLEGVKGESMDHKHRDEIDVLSWSWGMSQSGTAHLGGGAGAGKVTVQNLSLTHYVDQASPTLMFFCCNGKHIKTGKLTVRKAGEKPLEYLTIELEDILIANVSTGASESRDRDDRSIGGVGAVRRDRPAQSPEDQLLEHVTLNFARVRTNYTRQTPDGSAGPKTEMGWNIPANEKY